MSLSRTCATISTTVLLGSAAVAVAPAGAARTPGLLDCSRALQVRPATYVLACGDGNAGLARISWSRFGGATARGTGVLSVNGCDPNCAEGSYHRTRVRIVATRVRTIAGKPSYSRLSLTRTNGKTAGRYGVDARGPYPLGG